MNDLAKALDDLRGFIMQPLGVVEVYENNANRVVVKAHGGVRGCSQRAHTYVGKHDETLAQALVAWSEGLPAFGPLDKRSAVDRLAELADKADD